MPPTTAAAAVDFLTAAQRTLADLAVRVGLPTWWIGRVEGPDQVLLVTVDPLLGLSAGDALPWADVYCRRVVEEGAHPILRGLQHLPESLAALADGQDLSGTCLVSVPLTAPDGRLLATMCGLGPGDGAQLPGLLDSIRLQADLLGALLAAELELTERSRAAERAAQNRVADEVTGVVPLAVWQSALTAEEERAARHALPVSVLVLELSDLAALNAAQGLPAGDSLLHRAATAVAARLRSADLLARTGGNRFGVLLPGTGTEGARALTQRLRTALAAEGVSVRTGHATRTRTTTLPATWAAAEKALSTDVATTASASSPVVPVASPVGGGALDAMLDLARRQLGAEVAFISTLEGEHRFIRNVASPTPVPMVPGMSAPLDGSLCSRVLRSGQAVVAPDTTVGEFADSNAARLGMGSYVGVPLRRRNGSLYGTLCAVSRGADHDLHERDADVLDAVAGAVMELVEEEDGARRLRRSRLARLADLEALGGPQVVYQPIVDLASGIAVGAEALSRFPAGTPTPDRWFADAAEVGHGEELELLALRNAVHGLPHVPGFLALNLSPSTITTPAFARALEGLPLDRVVVEITEHAAVSDYSVLLSMLSPLRARGLRIAVDDTGAGYASLSHVLAVLPDFIKLDISLVRGIDADTSRRALAAGLVTFATATGALIIAEGIETASELAALRELGVQLGQGYHLARPAALASP
ncbi:EAL domain-containing protein [Kineococcus sp. SYSU DK003]|uniref:EAL domain-containing protein n=1 Tax=Kineococcus sp. SYSU DK003 TaxID=3383124 RepID=UPI003D7DB41F